MGSACAPSRAQAAPLRRVAIGECDKVLVQINAEHTGPRLSHLNRQSSVATADIENAFAGPVRGVQFPTGAKTLCWTPLALRKTAGRPLRFASTRRFPSVEWLGKLNLACFVQLHTHTVPMQIVLRGDRAAPPPAPKSPQRHRVHRSTPNWVTGVSGIRTALCSKLIRLAVNCSRLAYSST